MRVLEEYAERKPALVFCNTRKAAVQAAQHLAREAAGTAPSPFVYSADHHRHLSALAQRLKDRALADVCRQGTAFHHGGLAQEDRRAIEDAFLQGHLAVLCTLALTCLVRPPPPTPPPPPGN
jgi:replicative superfamily II helicase